MKLLTQICLFLVLLLSADCLAQRPSPWESLRESQIQQNVPNEDQFEQILHRDLKSHFARKHPKLSIVEIFLFRKQATVSGLSSPKFYLWAEGLDEEGNSLFEAATRVAAAAKKEFFVLNYLYKDEINEEPDKVKSIFPKALVQSVLECASKP